MGKRMMIHDKQEQKEMEAIEAARRAVGALVRAKNKLLVATTMLPRLRRQTH